MSRQEADVRVARGMAWFAANSERLGLDVFRNDPNNVNVTSDTSCVLATAAGETFHVAIDRALPADFDTDQRNLFIWSHGFAGAPDCPCDTCECEDPSNTDLALAWGDAIRAARRMP